MSQQDQIVAAASRLETALKRFHDEFQMTGSRHYGNQRRGNTELADAWAWTLNAFENLVPLVKNDEVRARLNESCRIYGSTMNRMFEK